MSELQRPVGLQEIAVLHGYRRTTAYRWRGRHRLPDPSFHLSGHFIWADLDAIVTWSRQTGRYQKAIDKWSAHLDGKGLSVGDLTFEVLYDLLRLGRAQTRVEEIGVPSEEEAA
jgi:hypothetical protein